MNRPRSSSDGFPLFPCETDIWNALDELTRGQVLDKLALLFLRHLQHTTGQAEVEQVLTKENTP
jgi:hypothetical protein